MTVFSFAFCCLSQWLCEPVLLSLLHKAAQTCGATVGKKSPWELLSRWTSEHKELLGGADPPSYLFRNKALCTAMDYYLPTSPFLCCCWKKKKEECFLKPGFFCLFSCLPVAVAWLAEPRATRGYMKECFHTWQLCSVGGRERKAFVGAENRYFISNGVKIPLNPFFCVRCCTW